MKLKEDIKRNFDKIDKQTILSYNYFINNSELVLFAFKRFNFKLLSYHYKIDEEKSLIAKFGEGATKSGATLKGIFEKAIGKKDKKK